MNTRELWQNIINYGDFDRMPVIHWSGWDETRLRWIEEGMPANADEHQYFNAVPQWWHLGANFNPYPAFEEEIIEETEEYRIFHDATGVIKKKWKNKTSVPQYIDYTFKTRKTGMSTKSVFNLIRVVSPMILKSR